MKGQSEVLQLISQGKPLETVLDKLIVWLEKQLDEGLITSILCTDETGTRIHLCVGKRLPKAYVDAIIGLPIGPNVGSCGTPAYTDRLLIAENITDDRF